MNLIWKNNPINSERLFSKMKVLVNFKALKSLKSQKLLKITMIILKEEVNQENNYQDICFQKKESLIEQMF